MKFPALFKDVLNLLYPTLCAACRKKITTGEKTICIYCKNELPKTNYHNEPENFVEKMFWGRVAIHAATAYLHFNKGLRVQQLMHSIKYQRRKETATEVGRLLGHELMSTGRFEGVDVIVPVPLHRQKLRRRGFNQSEWFGKGLSAILQVPQEKLIIRTKKTETQTRKTRYKRWENVKDVFTVADKKSLQGLHVLLIDDVITTGSTLEACAQVLLAHGCGKISIATIAVAD